MLNFDLRLMPKP